MEALRAATLICEVDFLGAKWGGFGVEIGRMDGDRKNELRLKDAIDTRATSD